MRYDGNQAEDEREDCVPFHSRGVDWFGRGELLLRVWHLHFVALGVQPPVDEEAAEKEALCAVLWSVRGWGFWSLECELVFSFGYLFEMVLLFDDERSATPWIPLYPSAFSNTGFH